MRSVAPMRVAKIGYIVLSVVFCTVGVLFIARSDIGTQVLSLALGIAMIVFGGIKIVGYFSKDLFRLAFQYDLELGIISAVLGIIVLLNPFHTITFVFIAMGISILADALFKIRIAMEARRFGIEAWWLILILAALTAVAGLLLVFRPWESANILTVLLAVELAVTLIVVRRHYDVIQREYVPATAETATLARQRFGNANVALLLKVHPAMLACYDTAVAANVAAMDEVDSLKADYVVTSRLSDEEMLRVRQRWPYMLDYKLCTGTKICLISRRPDGALPWRERVVKDGLVTVGDEYTMLLDTVAGALGDNRHVLVNSVVRGADSSVTLVMETYVGGRRVDWHGVDAADSASLPLALDGCIKSRWAFRHARVKVYLWRRGGQTTGTASYRITVSDGNPYIYSLLEEI